MKVLITGSQGFLAKNLLYTLGSIPDFEILCADRSTSDYNWDKMISEAEFIFHLAGVNRPLDPQAFYQDNTGFTRKIVDRLLSLNHKTPIVLSSSIQATNNNDYGLSKIEAEKAIFQYSKETGATVWVFRLPNIFGKWCKPDYNSVVATFCHNITHNLPILVNEPLKNIDLVHVSSIVDQFKAILMSWFASGKTNTTRFVSPPSEAPAFHRISPVFQISLGELASKLEYFNKCRNEQLLPNLSVNFDHLLFSTFCSFLPADKIKSTPEMKRDQRGWLFELLKSPSAGQFFISKTLPGVTRGNHYHHNKIEKFTVIRGKAKIQLQHLISSETLTIDVTDDPISTIDIPPGYTHSIQNTGDDEMLCIFWASEIFNPSNPDTTAIMVNYER